MSEIVSTASRLLARARLEDRLRAEIENIQQQLDEARSAAVVSSTFGDRADIKGQGILIDNLEQRLERAKKDLEAILKRSPYTGF